MRSRKPSNLPGLGRYSLLCHGHSTALTARSNFLFLLWPLDGLGWSVWLNSFSFFYSLVSKVASSTRVYLLVVENISSDVLGFFMASLWIKDESLSPLLKSMMIDLSLSSRMTFLLLQKH
jgi:hypothetical protein